MAEASLITQINDWMIDQALGDPDIIDLFDGVCQRLSCIGIPIARARLMWSTLHPLFRAETVLWQRGQPAELEQIVHTDLESPAWLRSPMRFMLDAGVPVLRRRLAGPGKLLDFQVLEELAEQGYTDYVIVATELSPTFIQPSGRRGGIFVIWTSDRLNGFTDDDLTALQRIQRRLAVACKTVIQSRIARNITEAYLGRQAGERVLNGSIRLGDGQATQALVWFSDLRNSTRLAETLPSAEFIELLNVYFECAARPVISEGGEVLSFIGDAVLAIFPFTDPAELPRLAARAFSAVRQSLEMGDRANAERIPAGKPPVRYGIGLNTGPVMYGNIGVPERLAFTAIGPTVIEVARIEKLTKSVGARALATREIAMLDPQLWHSIGQHGLEGLGEPQELFGFREEAAAEAA
jgi:adenylate cyclase